MRLEPGTIYPSLDEAMRAASCLSALAPNGAIIHGTTTGPDVNPTTGEAYQVSVQATDARGATWEAPSSPYDPLYTIVRWRGNGERVYEATR